MADHPDAPSEEIPSAHDIKRVRADQKRAQRNTAPAQTFDELRDWAYSQSRTDSTTPGDAWVIADPSVCYVSNEVTSIPFTCDYLLDEVLRFRAKTAGKLRLLIDFTHDLSNLKWKVGKLSLLGKHFDKHHARWASTEIPVSFSLASTDSKGTVQSLVRATLMALTKRS